MRLDRRNIKTYWTSRIRSIRPNREEGACTPMVVGTEAEVEVEVVTTPEEVITTVVGNTAAIRDRTIVTITEVGLITTTTTIMAIELLKRIRVKYEVSFLKYVETTILS